jgi:hypothetical protein
MPTGPGTKATGAETGITRQPPAAAGAEQAMAMAARATAVVNLENAMTQLHLRPSFETICKNGRSEGATGFPRYRKYRRPALAAAHKDAKLKLCEECVRNAV